METNLTNLGLISTTPSHNIQKAEEEVLWAILMMEVDMIT